MFNDSSISTPLFERKCKGKIMFYFNILSQIAITASEINYEETLERILSVLKLNDSSTRSLYSIVLCKCPSSRQTVTSKGLL